MEGKQSNLESVSGPERPETAILEDLMDNIDRILAVQQKKQLAQQKLADMQLKKAEALDRQEPGALDVTAHIEAIRQVTGYTFKDPDYVRGAIFKTGKIWKGKDMGRPIQFQLALIGDKFLDFGSLSANFGHGLDTIRPNWSWLMSNAVLHYCAQRLGLPQKLAESGHAALIQGDSWKGFGTMVEAIVGAVYEDSGRDGAVTDAVTAKLLGTTMRHDDVAKFAASHKASIKMPTRGLYWRELVEAETRLKLERLGRVDEIDEQMEKMHCQELVVDRARRGREARARRVTLPPLEMNATGGIRRRAPVSVRSLSGDRLRRHIDQIKASHRKYAERRTRRTNLNAAAKGFTRKKPSPLELKLARLQAYIDEAEEHLSRGEGIRAMT